MNAYELADELDAIFTKGDWEEIPNVVAMLRQQADRIAELEKEAEACWCQGHSEAYLKAKGRLPNQVSSKPVGRYYWESVADYQFMAVPSEGTIHYEVDDFPLYTHPVKQLSDEEIKDICKKIDVSFDGVDTYIFARAIIKEITE